MTTETKHRKIEQNTKLEKYFQRMVRGYKTGG